jgi:hypothetical protein
MLDARLFRGFFHGWPGISAMLFDPKNSRANRRDQNNYKNGSFHCWPLDGGRLIRMIRVSVMEDGLEEGKSINLDALLV